MICSTLVKDRQKHNIIFIALPLKSKRNCSAAFLDVRQTLKGCGITDFLVFKSYFNKRLFIVTCDDAEPKLKQIQAGVPQGSVHAPVLCTLFTAFILCSAETICPGARADQMDYLLSHQSFICQALPTAKSA